MLEANLGNAVADIDHVVTVGETSASNIETLDHDVTLSLAKCRNTVSDISRQAPYAVGERKAKRI